MVLSDMLFSVSLTALWPQVDEDVPSGIYCARIRRNAHVMFGQGCVRSRETTLPSTFHAEEDMKSVMAYVLTYSDDHSTNEFLGVYSSIEAAKQGGDRHFKGYHVGEPRWENT